MRRSCFFWGGGAQLCALHPIRLPHCLRKDWRFWKPQTELERVFLQQKASVLPLLLKKNCGHATNRNHMWNLWTQCVSYRAESVAKEVSVVATNSPSPWQHHTCCQLFYDHCCMVMQLKHRRELCALSCCRIRSVTLTKEKKKNKPLIGDVLVFMLT